MDLAQELAKFRADFERTAPAGRAALYDAKVEELGANFPLSAALAVGDIAPKFALPNARRRQISLSEMLQKGPAVVTFAAADIGSLQIAGLPAWLLWSTAHIYFLVGFRNRIVVGANW
ncbi:MAG TPA: hypothetical protein VGD54_20920, partial [Steroidobacteraceae bacterium]